MKIELKWDIGRANSWYEQQPWLLGCNYLPSSVVNSTEMWQASTFDTETMERELSWAAHLGLNCLRVFLPFVVWEDDPEAFLARVDAFLSIADANGLRVMPILFDDCAFAGCEPRLGPQPQPVPGVHNSQWTPSPGFALADDTEAWPRLEKYARSVVGAFARDRRILLWDVYNEPGNSDRGEKSLPLLHFAFAWARDASPSQPLTAGVWHDGLTALNERQIDLSDVISFHRYDSLEDMRSFVERLRVTDRPLICTEWMARTLGSLLPTHLPYFQKEKIGAVHWGLVRGRTQTHLPWGWSLEKGEPDTWFHDLLYPDGLPFDPRETEFLKSLSQK